MAYPAHVPNSVYRPKKLPRVIRRQLPGMRVVALIVLAGLVGGAVTLKNLINERLRLDVGFQQSQIESLDKEIQQLEGQIKVEASYGKLAKWAYEKHGWRANEERVAPLAIAESSLTRTAQKEAELLGVIHDETTGRTRQP
jgi:hypothetical protein